MDDHDGKVPFTLEEMTSGLRKEKLEGENEEGIKNSTFAYICDRFYPVVVGSMVWRRFHCQLEIRQFVNKTDEGLVWFILENNYKTWVAAYKKKMGDLCEEESEENGVVEVPQPQYTATNSGRNAQKYRGWNNDGTTRWNTIVDEIVKVRSDKSQKFDTLFLQWKKRLDKEDQEKKHRKRVRLMVEEEEEEITMTHGFEDTD